MKNNSKYFEESLCTAKRGNVEEEKLNGERRNDLRKVHNV